MKSSACMSHSKIDQQKNISRSFSYSSKTETMPTEISVVSKASPKKPCAQSKCQTRNGIRPTTVEKELGESTSSRKSPAKKTVPLRDIHIQLVKGKYWRNHSLRSYAARLCNGRQAGHVLVSRLMIQDIALHLAGLDIEENDYGQAEESSPLNIFLVANRS